MWSENCLATSKLQKTTSLKVRFVKNTTIHFFFAENTMSSVIFLQITLIDGFGSTEHAYDSWGPFLPTWRNISCQITSILNLQSSP